MFTLSITNEKCPACSTSLDERVVEIEHDRHVSDKKGVFAEAPFTMCGNEKYDEPYAAWHCPEFQTVESNPVLSLQCPNCECEITFTTGIISKFIRKPAPEVEYDFTAPEANPITQYQDPAPLTFLKWLKEQKNRDDCVGDISRDFFAVKHFIKTGSYKDNIPRDTNNYLAMRQYFYSKRAVVGDSFEMAWREFMVASDGPA